MIEIQLSLLSNGAKETMKILDVSIIIVNWNTRDLVSDCLRSIYDHVCDIAFEIIVIDNHSTDDSAEMIKNKFPQVRLIENPINRGFAAANNQGIAMAKGRYVLLLNSDTVLLDNAIARTVAFADSCPQAGIVGCRVLNADKTLQRTCFMFPSLLNLLLSSSYLYKLFPGSRFFGRERMTWWSADDVRKVDVVSGCFMLVRQNAINEVGLMDESFFMYAEETDWCYRFKEAGWKVIFAPIGEILHLGGQSSRKVREEAMIQLRLSILKFIGKHHSRMKLRLARLLTTLFWAVRVPIWLAAGVFGFKRRKQAMIKLRAYVKGIRHVLFTPVNSLAGEKSG